MKPDKITYFFVRVLIFVIILFKELYFGFHAITLGISPGRLFLNLYVK